MSQQNILKLEFLIAQSLQPQGITAHVGLKEGCLYVSFVSDRVPDRQALVSFIRRTLTELGDESIKTAKISGRQAGQTSPAWQEEIKLKYTSIPNSSLNAQIQGNISGQLAVGSYIIQIGSVYGGEVNIASNQQPREQPRPTPVYLLPHSFPNLVGRQKEIKSAIAALQLKRSVQFYSSSGLGKTVLLRHLAYHPQVISPFPDGIVSFAESRQPISDLLQSFFEAFYDSNIPFKPTDTQIRHYLQGKQALILLDRNPLARDEVSELLNVLPNCTFLLAASEYCLLGEGLGIKLGGLPCTELLVLLEQELQRELTVKERSAAQTLCHTLKGHPLQLLLTVASVREGERSLTEVVCQFSSKSPLKSLCHQIFAFLSKPQQQILTLLAALGGVALLIEHAAALTQLTDIEIILQTLQRWNLVQAEGNRYSISKIFVEVFQPEDLTVWQEKIGAYFTTWVQKYGIDPGGLLAEIDAIGQSLEWAVKTKHWTQVLSLVKAVEGALALDKRWGLWQQFLEGGLQAARALSDKTSEAYICHQIGTRALCLEDYTTASAFLKQALQLRESLGDQKGIEVTRHNLNLVPVLPPPPQPDPVPRSFPVWFKGAIGLLILALGGVILSILRALDPITQPLATPSPAYTLSPPPSPKVISKVSLNPNRLVFRDNQSVNKWQSLEVTITNQGTVPLKVGLIDPSEHFKVGENQCPNLILPGNSCKIRIRFFPKKEGEHRAKLDIFDRDNKLVKSLPLSGRGINRPPVAKNDAETTPFNQPVEINVLVNDTAQNVDELKIDNYTQPVNGRVIEITRSRRLMYTPKSDFSGEDKFTYTVSDGKNVSLPGTVRITVENQLIPENRLPEANDDSITITSTEPRQISENELLENDRDDDPGDQAQLKIQSISRAEKGRVELNADRTITYIPPCCTGTIEDKFTYKISDGKGGEDTATVTIKLEKPENRPPNAIDDSITITSTEPRQISENELLENDRDDDPGDQAQLKIQSISRAEKGRVELNADRTLITYTPPCCTGTIEDKFTYTISDGKGGENTATVTITGTIKLETPTPERSEPPPESPSESIDYGNANLTPPRIVPPR